MHVAYVLVALYALWALFVIAMGLMRARDNGTISKMSLVLGTPLVIAGYLLDIAVNLTVCTVIFLDFPYELTVTARLKRYLMGQSPWRRDAAAWIAINLLDAFDPSGKHV